MRTQSEGSFEFDENEFVSIEKIPEYLRILQLNCINKAEFIHLEERLKFARDIVNQARNEAESKRDSD